MAYAPIATTIANASVTPSTWLSVVSDVEFGAGTDVSCCIMRHPCSVVDRACLRHSTSLFRQNLSTAPAVLMHRRKLAKIGDRRPSQAIRLHGSKGSPVLFFEGVQFAPRCS